MLSPLKDERRCTHPGAGERTREAAAQIGAAIKDTLKSGLILARLATVRPPRYSIRTMRSPEPVGLHEHLPEADLGRCRTPRCRLAWLWYQREERPRYPKHFFFCGSCGQRYAAWEAWSPGAAN
jgi:hypothetical protein